MSLVEAARKPISAEMLIGPQFNPEINSKEFLPHKQDLIKNAAPLGEALFHNIQADAISQMLRRGVDLKERQQEVVTKLVSRSRNRERAYFGFDLVRRHGGTTGLEGYGAGYFSTGADIAEAIAKLGAKIVYDEKKNRAKAGDHLFTNRLWKFILNGEYDEGIAEFMNTSLAVLLAKLRAQTANDRPVDEVRQQVFNLAIGLTPIEYSNCTKENCLRQKYKLPQPARVQSTLSKLLPVEAINPDLFRGRPEYWGYLYMLKIGMFAHPIVREAVHQGLLLAST